MITFEGYERRIKNVNAALAQYNIGFMYQNGEGVQKDFNQAVKWFEKAADQGDVQAQYSLGMMYLNEKDYKRAPYWFKQASNQGNAQAQYNLGMIYFNGEGVKKDYKRAAEWFSLSCNGGFKEACLMLKN